MKGRKRSFSSLMDAVVIYDREKVVERFRERATYSLLTEQEENMGLDIVNDIYNGKIEPGAIWRKFEELPDHVSEALRRILEEFDRELPKMFEKCQTPYEVRSKMLDMGFSSKDELEDQYLTITFYNSGFSLSQKIPSHVFSTASLAKLAYIVVKAYDKHIKLTRSFIL